MFCAARALVMRSLAATDVLLLPSLDALASGLQRPVKLAVAACQFRRAAVVHFQSGPAAGVVDVCIRVANGIGVVPNQIGINPRAAEAAIEGLFRVGVAVLLRLRL